MNKHCLILLLFLLQSFITFSQNGNELEISLAGEKKSLQPGKIHTFVYKIRNNSPETFEVFPELQIPSGWKQITGLKSLSIRPNGLQIQIVSVNIPSQFKVGAQTITFVLKESSETDKALFSYQSEVFVEKMTNFSVSLVEAPPNAMAGDEIKASFILRNDGNSEQSFSLIPSNCTIDDPGKVTLAPNASAIINTSIKTSKELQSVEIVGYYLKVKSDDGIEKQAYNRIQILPKSQEADDLFHRFPVNISTRILSKSGNGNTSTGYQIEISGKGSIDPEGKHEIEFLARGPNQFNVSHLGLYDQYFISYKNDRAQLAIGDKSFSLSPLTEQARYGTGVEAIYQIDNRTAAGFFYVSPKFINEIKSEYALYAKREFSEDNNLQLNLLRKNLQADNSVNIISLLSNVKLMDKTHVEIELARGKEESKSDNAFRVSLNSQLSKFSVSSFYFYTGKDFPGYYTNSSFYSGFVNYQLLKSVSLSVNARRDFSNAQLDTLFSTAPYSRSLQAGLNLKIGPRSFFKATVRTNEREDRLPTKKFHYEIRSYNTNISHSARKYNVRLGGSYGKTTNFLQEDNLREKNTFGANMNFGYRPRDEYSIQLHGSYSNVNSFISENQNDFIFGINATAQPIKNLSTSIHVQNSYSIEEYYRNRNLLQFSLGYLYKKKHNISISSYYTIFQHQVDDPDLTVTLNYAYKFGIPLKQIAEAGSVSGRIVSEDQKSTKGIIVYLNGMTAITDKDGNFSFKNIKPGKYNVMIDRSLLMMDDIVSVITPIEIEVVGSQDTKLNLAITKAAKLSGRFEITKSSSTTKLLESEDISLGQIVLELNKENESYRIISNPDGSFTFPYVRPGKWFLKVYKSGIDKQYVLEKELFEFNFEPGDVEELVIKIRKKQRKIIFMNNSVNLSSGGKK